MLVGLHMTWSAPKPKILATPLKPIVQNPETEINCFRNQWSRCVLYIFYIFIHQKYDRKVEQTPKKTCLSNLNYKD